MPVLVPTQPPVRWAWGWPGMQQTDHSCPFTVALRLSVCVELNLHSPACLHGTQRNNVTDTTLHWKHWIRFVSEDWLLHTYCWVQFANDSVFSSLKWWLGCCVFLWVCMMQGRSIWSPSYSSKKVDNATFFFFPPILHSTEAGAFLLCDFLEYCPRGERKGLHHFHMFVFLGVHFTAFGVLSMLWMQ